MRMDPEVDVALGGDGSRMLERRADEDAARSGPAGRLSIAPSSAVCSQGWATAVGTASRLLHRSSICSYFPVPVSVVMTASQLSRAGCAVPGPVSRRITA
mgnify:CR=1 FL=1